MTVTYQKLNTITQVLQSPFPLDGNLFSTLAKDKV